MAKKKLVGDPFFPDEHLDIPDFDYKIPEPKNDRNPTVKIAKAAVKGAVSSFKDSAFIKRLLRESLPPVYGEIDDMRSQAETGIKKLYNSAAKEIKPSLNELSRSVEKLVPNERKKIKAAVSKIARWTSADSAGTRTEADEADQREKNIALELGRIFSSQSEQQQAISIEQRSEDRAEKRIRDAIDFNRHKTSQAALNQISTSLQGLDTYQTRVTSQYQKKSLELQMRSYWLATDAFKQQKKDAERMTAELTAITKNTALPEFVKLKKNEAWREHVRNRFISEASTGLSAGLFGKRANFVGNFFNNLGNKVKDKAVEAAGVFSQAASGAEAASMVGEMSKDSGGSAKESAAGLAGSVGAQTLALKAGRKVREKLEANPRANKAVKDLEYNVRNVPQALSKYANTDKYDDGVFTRAVKGLLRAGMGSLSPDMRMQTDSLLNSDPNNANGLRAGAQFNNQNSKSLNEIIPGYLARIFRELQVIRTGDNRIGLTTYDFTKNRFLDSGKVSRNILKTLTGDVSKQAHQERVSRIMETIGADKELDESTRTALAEALTKENFKGTKLDPEFLTKSSSYSKNDKIKKNADKIASLFKKYFGVKGYDQEGKPIMANDLETSEKINNINKEMGRLGMDFNDARVIIQELINIGQYQELRNIGILDEDKRSVDMNKLIELYSYGADKPKSYGVGGRNVFSTIAENSGKAGGSQTINNYQQKSSDGLDGKGRQEITDAMKQFGSKIDDLVKVTSESKQNDYATNTASGIDKIAEHTKTTNEILERIQNVLDERLKIVINRMPAGEEGGIAGLRNRLRNVDMTAIRSAAGERLDTISGSAKNIYNKTIGRGLNMIKPVTSRFSKLNKFWWNSTAKPLAKGVVKTAGFAGRVATDQILKIRDIYIDGENEPRLLAVKLKAGQYVNAKTGEVIKKIHEIKDGVRDLEGNIVLAADEVKKAYTRNASGGIVSVTKEFLSNVFSGIGKFQGFMHRTITIPAVRAALTIGKTSFNLARNLFDQATDIYVKGEAEPALLAITMRAGGYVSKVSQKVITRPSQIDGPVLDKEGNIVLSEDMLKKGIVDKNGRSVGSPLANFGRFIGAGVRTAFNVARKVTGGINSFFNGALGKGGEMLGDFFGKLSNALGGGKSYDVLVEIKNLLDKRLPQSKAKNKFLDLDGDGIRDGSTQDILKKRGEKKDNKDDKSDSTNLGGVVDSGRENTIDRIANGVGSVKDKVKDWLGMGDGVDVDIDADKRRRRRKRKVRMGRAAQAAKRAGGGVLDAGKSIAGRAAGTATGAAVGKAATTAAGGLSSAASGLGGAAMTAGGFLARNALKVAGGVGTAYGLYSAYDNASKGNYGSAALDLGLAGVSGAAMLGGTAGLAGLGSAALTAGGAVLSGAAALFSAPVVLGALAVGGAAYGGYKLYKYLTKPNMKPLSRMRMAQYGFGTDDADYLGKVQAFEKEMKQYVRYDEDKAKLEIDDDKASKLISFFDFQAQDRDQLNNWMMWVQKRFKPVFLTHMSALKSLGKEDSIFSVDELETAIQSKYLNMVKFPEGPYGEMASPFPGLKKLEVGHAVVKYVTKLAEEEIAKKIEEDKTKTKGTLEAGASAATTAEAARSKLGLNDNKDEINAAAIDKANESMLTKFARGVKDSLLAVPILKISATSVSIIGKTVGKWMGFGVEADEAVRFKTYGLIEMDRLKVIGLRNLEEYMGKNLKFNSDGSAKWEGSLAEALSECKADFGISSKTDQQAKDWMKWFSERFTPTYLAYMSYLRQATGKEKQADCEKSLKPEDRADIAAKVAAMDVWSKVTSPWRDYKLSTDATSVKVNIQLLDSQSKDSKLNEKKSSATKPSTGLAAALNKDPKKEGNTPEAKPDKPAVPTTGLGGSGATSAAAGGVAAIASPEQEGETKPPAQSAAGQPALSGSGGTPAKAATGPLKDGSGADKSITFYKNAKLNGVHPAVLKLFKGMVEEYAEITGKTVRVNDGFRSFEEQKALHEKDPKKAAPPGSSLHESGLAIDIDSAVADEMEKMGLMRKYGFTRPVGGEPWHLEPAGIQMDRKGAKKDAGKAEALVNSSPGKGGGGWGTNPNAGKYSRNDGMAKRLFEEGNGANTIVEQEMAGLPVSKVNGATSSGDLINKLKERGLGTGSAAGGGAGGTGLATPASDAVANNKDSRPGTALGYGNTPNPSGKGSGYAAVKDTISEASKLVGVDEKTMVTKAALESSFNPNARAGTSNATGLYQFVPGTWNEMMRKYGKKYGIPEGTPPTDARANAILAAQYMKDNEATLKNARGGGAVNGTDRYMAHFFGPGGATQMINADPNAIAASVLPKSAASNKETFYDANGRPRTVAEVRSFLDNKVNTALKKHGIDESQFGGETAVAKAPDSATTQPAQGNPNIVKASFNPSTPSASPIALPANRVTPEALAAKEREQQRMALSQALKPATMLRAPSIPEPMQVQQRMDSNQVSTGTKGVLDEQLTVQKSIAETLTQILQKMDFSQIKDAIAAAGKGSDSSNTKAEDALLKQGTPGKSDRPTVERTPSPIGFSRMT